MAPLSLFEILLSHACLPVRIGNCFLNHSFMWLKWHVYRERYSLRTFLGEFFFPEFSGSLSRYKKIQKDTNPLRKRHGLLWKVLCDHSSKLTITITIYCINPSGKLKLSFDRTTKNIIILNHKQHDYNPLTQLHPSHSQTVLHFNPSRVVPASHL